MLDRQGKKNVLILKRPSIQNKMNEISEKVEIDVQSKQIVPLTSGFKSTTIYAIKFQHKWYRAVVKFIKPDRTAVFAFLDKQKVIDFRPGLTIVEIDDQSLLQIPPAEFKFMIYGVGVFNDNEYQYVVENFKNTQFTAIYALIEPKAAKNLECFVGDLLYDVNGQTKSFREIIIREGMSHPSGVTNEINKAIFEKRQIYLNPKYTTLSSVTRTVSHTKLPEVSLPRFEFGQLLAEGGVSSKKNDS